MGNNTKTNESKDSLDKNLLLRRPHTSVRTEKVGSPKTSRMDTIMEEEDGMELTKSLSNFSQTERSLSERYDESRTLSRKDHDLRSLSESVEGELSIHMQV